MTTPPLDSSRPSPGRLWLVLGIVLPLLGILAYIVQIRMHRLTTPLYVPITATLGVVLLVVAMWHRRSVWRIIALLFVVLLAGFEWTAFLAMRLPAYTGPVAVGQSFPAFSTLRADGSPFTQHDLEGEQNHVLVFFRGRW